MKIEAHQTDVGGCREQACFVPPMSSFRGSNNKIRHEITDCHPKIRSV